MKKQDVVEFFGGPTATGRALGLTHAAVCNWGDEVPATRQRHVELVMQMEIKRREKEARKVARREARKAEKEA